MDKISRSRSMKMGLGSANRRLDREKRSEFGSLEWSMESIVSKSFPPTFRFMRSLKEGLDFVDVPSSSIIEQHQEQGIEVRLFL